MQVSFIVVVDVVVVVVVFGEGVHRLAWRHMEPGHEWNNMMFFIVHFCLFVFDWMDDALF